MKLTRKQILAWIVSCERSEKYTNAYVVPLRKFARFLKHPENYGVTKDLPKWLELYLGDEIKDVTNQEKVTNADIYQGLCGYHKLEDK